MGEPPEGLLCRSYTHARTHPMVVGKIGRYTLPFQLSPAQVLALSGSFFVLVWTRRIWAHLPGLLNLLVQVAVPVAIAWALRHLRMEGRSPLRMGYGVIAYAFSPKGGVVGGRPYREPGTRTLRGTRIFVAAGPPKPASARSARGRARALCGQWRATGRRHPAPSSPQDRRAPLMGLAPRSRQRVAALGLAGALVFPVAAASAAAGRATAGVAALSAVVGLATAAWARSRGRRPLRRLTRWGTGVGAEAMRNLPTPQRPR